MSYLVSQYLEEPKWFNNATAVAVYLIDYYGLPLISVLELYSQIISNDYLVNAALDIEITKY